MASSSADEEQQSVVMTASCHSTTADELTAAHNAHSISSCSAGARDTVTADGSDVLAMPT